MIFSGELPDLVLQGTKTQTRRALVERKPCAYRVGRSYAVQRTRGGHAIARILVRSIRQERLGDISDADAIEEGFGSRDEFLFYVSRLWHQPLHQAPDQWRVFLDSKVWAITFELDTTEQRGLL